MANPDKPGARNHRALSIFAVWVSWLVVALSAPAEELAPSTADKLEAQHESWSEAVFDTAYRLDSFFGDARVEEELRKTWVRVRTDLHYRAGEGFELKPRLRAKLVLPNLKKRGDLILSADEVDELDEENDGETREVGEKQSRASAALRYLFRENDSFKLDADIGLRTKSGSVRAYTRLRGRKNFDAGVWKGQFSDRLYWYTDTGWENEARFDFERGLTDNWYTRLTSQLSVFEEKEGVFFDQSVSSIYSLAPRKTLAFDWISNFKSEPDESEGEKTLYETRLQARYRQNVHWDWFYIEVHPIMAFPSTKDYDLEWRALIRGEMVLGGYQYYNR